MQTIRALSIGALVLLVSACVYERSGSYGERYASPPPSYDAGTGDACGRDARADAADAADGAAAEPSDPCAGGAIDRFRELMIVDPSVTSGWRARNEMNGAPFSFRTQMETLAATRALAPAMTSAWLDQWRTIAPRPGLDAELVCPWLRASSANACDEACAYCAHRDFDLSRAPFRLLAIVNRIDLRDHAGACGASAGEGRLVYTAVDPKSGAALPFTVIVEYRVQTAGEAGLRAWAGRWHALGALDLGSAEYDAALAEIVSAFATADNLHRVRTNEVLFGAKSGLPWEMREFSLQGAPRALVATPMTSTPPLATNGTPELASWLSSHRANILAGDNALPEGMLAATALIPSSTFRWNAPGADPETRRAFSMNTCSGCHAGERDPDPLTFQHIAPKGGYYGTGLGARLSLFLDDPSRKHDELARREEELRAAACAPCPRADGGAYGARVH